MGRRKLPRGTDVESEASGHGGLSDGGDWSAGAWGIPWKREEERGAGRAGGQRRMECRDGAEAAGAGGRDWGRRLRASEVAGVATGRGRKRVICRAGWVPGRGGMSRKTK